MNTSLQANARLVAVVGWTGAEQYGKGWIERLHAYQELGPPETHWSLEELRSSWAA
jgi:hypothetical protein